MIINNTSVVRKWQYTGDELYIDLWYKTYFGSKTLNIYLLNVCSTCK